MYYITNIYKYTLTKQKIGMETRVIEASCLEDFFRKAVTDEGYVKHDLHFHTRNDGYLYRIKIRERHLTMKEFKNDEFASETTAASNFYPSE